MKAVIIFDNFGPYHLARLQAAAQVCDLTAVEVAGCSAEYAWKGRNEAGMQETAVTEGLNCITLFQEGTSHDIRHQEIAQRIDSTLDGLSPQAVFVPGWSSRAAFIALRWCVRHKTPAIMMSESTEWDEVRSSWREAIKQRIVRLCSAALVGGQAHEDYITTLGVPRERVFLGYDTVDNDYFASKVAEVKGQEPEVRKKLDLPPKYFLASARFIEKKNLPRLLEAYAKYRSYIENNADLKAQKSEVDISCQASQSSIPEPWHLVLLGDGALRSDLCQMISVLQLQHSVHLPGFVQYPDLPAYYGLANAFIHASTVEQWGLVVNEAMSSGLPVLVSDRCGCAHNLVQEGVNGFTFDPYDVEQLAKLMLKISDVEFPLVAYSNASGKIISHWGTARFADGALSAIECALKVGPKNPSTLDQLFLAALIRK